MIMHTKRMLLFKTVKRTRSSGGSADRKAIISSRASWRMKSVCMREFNSVTEAGEEENVDKKSLVSVFHVVNFEFKCIKLVGDIIAVEGKT